MGLTISFSGLYTPCTFFETQPLVSSLPKWAECLPLDHKKEPLNMVHDIVMASVALYQHAYFEARCMGSHPKRMDRKCTTWHATLGQPFYPNEDNASSLTMRGSQLCMVHNNVMASLALHKEAHYRQHA